jgi:hypothetical protein
LNPTSSSSLPYHDTFYQRHPPHDYDDLSDEEKEHRQFADYMRNKRTLGLNKKLSSYPSGGGGDNEEVVHGKELYAKMIKRVHSEIKEY